MTTKKTSSRKKTKQAPTSSAPLTVAHAVAPAPQMVLLPVVPAARPSRPAEAPQASAPKAVEATKTQAQPAAAQPQAPAVSTGSTPAGTAAVSAVTSPVLSPAALPASAPARSLAISPDERRIMIAKAAYRRAEQAGLGRTDPFQDWLAAEREIDALLARKAGLAPTP